MGIARLIAAFLVVATLSTYAQGQQVVASPAKVKAEGPRQYLFECHVVQYERDGSEKTLSRPRVITIGDQPATIKIGTEVPVLSGASPEAAGGTVRPTITVLESGTTMILKVTPDRPGHVTLDATLAIAEIDAVKVQAAADGEKRQSARVQTQTARAIECVELGKKITLSLEHAKAKKSRRVAEIVVSEIPRK